MKAIGIAGTAKNSGKTTTLAAVLEELSLRNVGLGLTSIGYDGERVDNVTGLSKPALTMLPGQWVATAEACLKHSSAGIRVVEKSDIITPLGRLVIGQVERWGSIILAGPNKSYELKKVLNIMAGLGVELGLVDGALNRLVPMSVTNGLVLATGASRHQDIVTLARESAVIQRICSLPKTDAALSTGVSIIGNEKILKEFSFGSILENAQVEEIIRAVDYRTKRILIPGIIGEQQMNYITKKIPNWHGLCLIFANPLKLIVSAELSKLDRFFDRVEHTGGKMLVEHRVPLIAVTINPFYPRFRYQQADYEPAYVNADRLFSKVQKAVNVLVVNVNLHGAQKLVDEIL